MSSLAVRLDSDELELVVARAVEEAVTAMEARVVRRLAQVERRLEEIDRPIDELLTARQLAELLQVDERSLRRLRAAGAVPPPVAVGTRPRWPRRAIEEWIADGSPGREATDA